MKTLLFSRLLLPVLIVVSLFTVPHSEAFLFFRGTNWRPVPPEQLSLAEPKIDPEAGIEYLLVDINVNDRNENTVYEFYLRYKVFDEKQLEEAGRYYISYERDQIVRNLAARVIRPNGEIHVMEGADVHDQEVLRHRRQRTMQKSFMIPGLEVGSIVEVQYRISIPGLAQGLRIPLAMKYPIQHLKVSIAPFGYLQNTVTFGHAPLSRLHPEEKPDLNRTPSGMVTLEYDNVSAVMELPFSPPTDLVIPWLRLSYTSAENIRTSDDFWRHWARVYHNFQQRRILPRNRHIRSKAEELIVGAKSDEEKLRILYNYAQNEIRNTGFRGHGYTSDELDKLADNNHAAHTLRRGYGTRSDINHLFASLSGAAGFDVRYAVCSNRSDTFFQRNMRYFGALNKGLIAVWLNDAWMFFDPGDRDLPFGVLEWYHAGTAALLAGTAREPEFFMVPMEQYQRGVQMRNGRFAIDETGTLSGTVEYTYAGQNAVDFRWRFRNRLNSWVIDAVEEDFKELHPRAEISEIRLHQIGIIDENPSVSFHIRIPGFAQVVGDRMFFLPDVFNQNRPILFKEDSREEDVYFGFEYDEVDRISIKLPDGFELDEPTAPQSGGDLQFAQHQVGISVSRNEPEIHFRRDFHIRTTLMEARFYPVIKSLFEFDDLQTKHMLALRRTEIED